MGCDIHAHFEIKMSNRWVHYSIPRILRDYRLFSKMAGVRNCNKDIEPISEPKGLPYDISEITKIESEHDNYHNFSWLSQEEMVILTEWYYDLMGRESLNFFHQQWGYVLGNGPENLSGIEDNPKEYEDIRIVFWFDN